MTVAKKRIFLYPGPMTSRNDGQVHFITASQLARLYGVPIQSCIIIREYNLRYREQEGDVHLYPQYNGNYKKVKLNDY